MSDNWIVQNLNSALNTWNEKLAEIWTLLTQSPESFKGGDIWSVITGINGALTAIGYGLLVLFFAAGIVKTCGSFTDMKKPEHALKAFIRFALAQGAIMYGMELMTALFSIVQGIVSTIMAQSGMTNGGVTELPAEIVEKIEAVGMLESIPLWIVTLLGSLLITVLSFIMILAAECGEFHGMGECIECTSLKEAFRHYQRFCKRSPQMLPSLEFSLHHAEDPLYNEGEYPLVTGEKGKELLSYVPYYANHPLVQEAVRELEQLESQQKKAKKRGRER